MFAEDLGAFGSVEVKSLALRGDSGLLFWGEIGGGRGSRATAGRSQGAASRRRAFVARSYGCSDHSVIDWMNFLVMESSKRLFGGSSGPPDKKKLSRWFGYRDVHFAQNALRSFSKVFFDQLGEEQLVEKNASVSDLSGDGAGFIKGKIIRLMTGPAPGYEEKPLTPSQVAVAQKVYDQIRLSRYGAAFVAGQAAALFNAATAWCAGQYELSKTIANHVISDINPDAGEAYRIRAFASISLGDFQPAVNDLKRALASTPQPLGAEEPLRALQKLLK